MHPSPFQPCSEHCPGGNKVLLWQPVPHNPRASGKQLLLARRALPGGSSNAEMTPVLAVSWNTGTRSPLRAQIFPEGLVGERGRTARSRIQVGCELGKAGLSTNAQPRWGAGGRGCS